MNIFLCRYRTKEIKDLGVMLVAAKSKSEAEKFAKEIDSNWVVEGEKSDIKYNGTEKKAHYVLYVKYPHKKEEK